VREQNDSDPRFAPLIRCLTGGNLSYRLPTARIGLYRSAIWTSFLPSAILRPVQNLRTGENRETKCGSCVLSSDV
jgi:hypothetical protein